MVSVGSWLRAFSRDVSTSSIGGDDEAYMSARGASPTPGCSVLSAARTYVQKRVGSLSPASSETQARGQALKLASARQALRRVVLPHPAGATTRASWPFIAAFNRSVSRGRVTTFRRRGGTEIFVVSRWRDGMLMAGERAGIAGGREGLSKPVGFGLVVLSSESRAAAS